MILDHGQLNVRLEGEGPPRGVLVHQAEQIVAVKVGPFVDGLGEDVYAVEPVGGENSID